MAYGQNAPSCDPLSLDTFRNFGTTGYTEYSPKHDIVIGFFFVLLLLLLFIICFCFV